MMIFKLLFSWFMNSMSLNSACIKNLFACGTTLYKVKYKNAVLAIQNFLRQTDLIETDRNDR